MKLTLILTTAIVGTASALPSASSAAPPPPPPTQDSVVLTGGPGEAGRSGLIVREIEATSGPSGEDPSGQVTFDFMGGPNQGGPVTCLSVSGHTAIIGTPNESVSEITDVIQVVDGQPDTFGVSPTSRAPTDCSPLPPEFFIGGPLSSGDIKVVDVSFTFGNLKRDRRHGTAKLAVEVPGPGELALARTKKIKGAKKRADAEGSVKLPVRPRGKAKRRLNKTGHVTVKAKVTHTPDGGEPNTQSKKLKLKKR